MIFHLKFLLLMFASKEFLKPKVWKKKCKRSNLDWAFALTPLSLYLRSYFNQHVDWTFTKHQTIIICAYFLTSKNYSISKPCVVTLVLGSRPKQGLAKVWAKSEAQESHFMLPRMWECGRVWRNEPQHSKMSSHFGSWNPDGPPNFQRAIAGVKPH